MSAVPIKDVQVELVLEHGWVLWRGSLRYKVLATRGVAYGTDWFELGRGLDRSLVRGLSRGRVVARLDARAARLGHVVRRSVVRL